MGGGEVVYLRGTAKPKEEDQKASQTNWNMLTLRNKWGKAPLNALVQITFVCFCFSWGPWGQGLCGSNYHCFGHSATLTEVNLMKAISGFPICLVSSRMTDSCLFNQQPDSVLLSLSHERRWREKWRTASPSVIQHQADVSVLGDKYTFLRKTSSFLCPLTQTCCTQLSKGQRQEASWGGSKDEKKQFWNLSRNWLCKCRSLLFKMF